MDDARDAHFCTISDVVRVVRQDRGCKMHRGDDARRKNKQKNGVHVSESTD